MKDRGLVIAAPYTENESGTRLDRPELFRLLADASPGDVLLVEQVDPLSRLKANDWEKLKGIITAKQVRIVAIDLPTSHNMAMADADAFISHILDAVNGMLLDMLAAVARKDYEDRRRRQSEGKYKGRAENVKRNAAIADMLKSGEAWSDIIAATACSRATLAMLSKRNKATA